MDQQTNDHQQSGFYSTLYLKNRLAPTARNISQPPLLAPTPLSRGSRWSPPVYQPHSTDHSPQQQQQHQQQKQHQQQQQHQQPPSHPKYAQHQQYQQYQPSQSGQQGQQGQPVQQHQQQQQHQQNDHTNNQNQKQHTILPPPQTSKITSKKSPGQPTTRRTRITRACDTCRRKKIKCDVDSMQPCSTCKQYGWECTFHDTAKKRGPPKGYIESLEARLRSMERLLETIQAEDRHTHKKRKGSQSDQSEQSEQSVEPSESASPTPPNEPNQSSQKPIAENHPPSHSEQGQNKVVGYMGSSSGYYLIGDIMTKAESKSADGFKVSASKGEGEPPGGAFIH